MRTGSVQVVDAYECDASRLRSVDAMAAVFRALIEDLELHAVQDPVWHEFPGEGGVTGFVLLSESHISCHTYPEHGFAALDLYCCRDLADWPWAERLGELLGAGRVSVRAMDRGEER